MQNGENGLKRGVDRRTLAKGAALLAAGAAQPALSMSRAATVRVVDLKVEDLARPVGIEQGQPRLSWRLEAERPDVRQSAYRVLVDNDPQVLARGRGRLWDSGRVTSDSSLGIAYAGSPLTSRQICWWTVEVWDEAGRKAEPLLPSSWEMGLLEPHDWSATWLAAERPFDRENRRAGVAWVWGPDHSEGKARQFRRGFELARPAEAARLIVVARDELRDLYIDGVRRAFPPASPLRWGPAPAVELDLGPLAAGSHLIAAQVALAQRKSDESKPQDAFAALLWVRFADGHELRIPTDETWRTSGESAGAWWSPELSDAGWATAGRAEVQEGIPWPPTPATYLRRPFEVRGALRLARLYVTALGACDSYLNGGKVGDAILAPESQDFRKRVRYRVHDVTAQMVLGANVLGLHVGDGYYASAMAPGGRFPFGPPPRRVLAQLELHYADGSCDVVRTGPDWRTAPSAVLASEIYNGETYDARGANDAWSRAGFDAHDWTEAEPAEPPPARLTAQTDPPIRIMQTLKAQRITQPEPTVHVVDFGQNFAGFCRLTVRGAAGDKVELRFGEVLTSDGRVDQSNLRGARATDIYILRGDPAGETYQPHFTYHGFRYVEMRGFPGALSPDAIVGCVVHSDLPATGRLRLSDPLLEQIWRNTVWSQRSNFVGIPTDCPQRDERLGWMGDANVFWDAAAFNMDVYAFTQRFCADIRDAQSADGAFSDYAPASVKVNTDPAPGWADAGVVLPWTAWWRFGDASIIEQHWPAMTRYLDFILARNPDYLWRNARGSDYGDWLALDAKQPGDPTTPKELVGTAYWAHSTGLVGQMAEAVGRTEEAQHYRATHARILEAFRRAFVRADGVVGNGSQTGYILALRFDLLPDDLRSAAVARLAADIRRRGTLLATGFLGTPNSLDVLADGGQGELVYDLLLRTAYPSWGHMVRKGATTMWERWNGDTGDVAMNSYNHYALGAVTGFMYRRIAGIEPTAPGFKTFRVRPVIDRRLKQGGADFHSPMGLISTHWRILSRGGLDLAVTVPANASAEVDLPKAYGLRYLMDGRAIHAAKRTPGEDALDAIVVKIGSGTHRFTSMT